ncbi:MAG: zinc-dependent peptidase [Saprospirales bacterium]|nr:zinc-dependent peptidase [Saprospirales bacterium]
MTVAASILVFLLLIGLVLTGYLLFRPKPQKEPEEAFPQAWRDLLGEHVRYYHQLDPAEKERFEDWVYSFILNCEITGVGVEVDDLDRLLVASSAAIPIFGFANWKRYPHLTEVLLYPATFADDTFATEGADRDVEGMVGWGYMNGKMILSKPALHLGFEQAGQSNVGIHEFVHLLDKADGETDGLPEYLLGQQYTLPWLELIHKEMEAIQAGDSDIRDYGGTSPTEFFAVASEYFFQRPHHLEQAHPELFAMLERIFKQDLS